MFDEQTLEMMRIELRNRYIKAYAVVAVFAVILGFVFSFFPLFGFMLGVVLGLIVVGLVSRGWNAPYVRAFKEAVAGETFRAYFNNVRTDYQEGFSEDAIESMGLISTGNRFSSDDYISGECNGVPFQRSDVYIANVTTDSEGHSHTTVYFEGRWMMFRFPKKIAGDLQILEKSFSYANRKNGIFTGKSSRRHKVEMEDSRFNHDFTVMAQQDQDAFYFLTPHRMEEIMRYCESIQGDVMIGIIGNILHVAVNNRKNAMEPKVFGQNNMQMAKAECEYEAQLIRKTVQFFDLDEEVFQG